MRTPKILALAFTAAALVSLNGCDDGGSEGTADATTTTADAIGGDATTTDDATTTSDDASTATDTQTDDTGTGDATAANEIEIAGTWDNDFDGTETIDDTSWTSFTTVSIIEFDNATNVAITQNPPDDEFNPDAFSRVVWTEPEADGFWYCIADFGLATVEDARASTAMADDTDPATGGCGGFAWTRLTPAP